MSKTSNVTGKVLYAILFLLIVPLILLGWAFFTREMIILPLIGPDWLPLILVAIGLFLMLAGMYSLYRYGKGLPMNAYPPSQFVRKGIYALLGHPIYWGFGFLMTGTFMWVGWASGLWLVSPVTILLMIGLVLGYEEPDLYMRFPEADRQTLLGIPIREDVTISFWKRLLLLIWIFGACMIHHYVFTELWDLNYNLDSSFLSGVWIQQTWILSISLSVIFICLPPVLLDKSIYLRRWLVSCLLGFLASILVAFMYPDLIMSGMPFIKQKFFSVPIFLSMVSALVIFRFRSVSGWLFLLLGILISVFSWFHLLDPLKHWLPALIIALASAYYDRLWQFFRFWAERIANSWEEWTIGKVRIINHGFYIGLASFIGIMGAAYLMGDRYAWAIMYFAIVVIIFSAVWAQLIEGSERLKRPFGYYGALVGILFASLFIWLLGYEVWATIAIISVFMPWVQAIGRFRCLVNGCCHGARTKNAHIGIRYYHHRSRVVGLSEMKGELLHPTPLYAIIWLSLTGFILLSFWQHGYGPSFIFGMYLILTGAGRFVEEAYRGEVQTPVIRGLRLYQWTAILSILIGIVMSCIPVEVSYTPLSFSWMSLIPAVIASLFSTFAMGVDFPFSNARFSRLV